MSYHQKSIVALGFTPGVVHFIDLHKCIIIHIHHHGNKPRRFSALNPLCSIYSSFPPPRLLATTELCTHLGLVCCFSRWMIKGEGWTKGLVCAWQSLLGTKTHPNILKVLRNQSTLSPAHSYFLYSFIFTPQSPLWSRFYFSHLIDAKTDIFKANSLTWSQC